MRDVVLHAGIPVKPVYSAADLAGRDVERDLVARDRADRPSSGFAGLLAKMRSALRAAGERLLGLPQRHDDRPAGIAVD